MKNLFVIVILSSLLQSCVSIYFTEPQFASGSRLMETPEELRGVWYKGEDKITIDQFAYTGIEYGRDEQNNIKDTAITFIQLCDTNLLFKRKNYYIFNYRTNAKPWEVAIIHKKWNGDLAFYESRETTLFEKDKNLLFKEANYTINGHDSTVYLLSGYIEGSSRFNSATYSGQMSYRTVKKITVRKNLIFILKKNGSIYTPPVKEEFE